MKKIPLLLAIGLIVFSCTNDKPTDTPSSTTSTSTDKTGIENPADEGVLQTIRIVDTLTGNFHFGKKPLASISSAISANPIIKMDSSKPAPTPPSPQTPQEERIVKVLTSNYWVVQALVRINDKEASRTNPGAWFKLMTDGSYEYGYMQNKIGTGAWSLDGKRGTVLLDSPLYGDDREWKMQIAKTEDVMVWIGTDRYNTTSINMKLLNLLFIPKNRKEIGLDY